MNEIDDQILKHVQDAAKNTRLRNMSSCGKEFIEYSHKSSAYVDSQVKGLEGKVLTLPGKFFMSVEDCMPKNEMGYCVQIYVPSPVTERHKCFLYESDHEDDEFHRHDYYELTYVYKGHRSMEVEDKRIVLNEGDIILFDMKCTHLDIRSRSEGIAFYMGITGRSIDSYFINHIKSKSVKNFFLLNRDMKADAGILRLKVNQSESLNINRSLYSIFCELENRWIGYEKIAQVEVLRILNSLCDERDMEYLEFSERLKGPNLYNAVAKYISSNLATVSLDELSAKFHFQRDYFNRLIRKNTGLTFSEYIKILRIEKARNLLVNTNMNVHEIMLYLGYEQHSYFYKIFREATGMTPIEYREQYS